MKVIQINSTDMQGGAARAAHRLFTGLQKIDNIQVEYWVQKKFSKVPNILSVHSNLNEKFIPGLKAVINNYITSLQETKNKSFHSTNILPTGLHKRINKSDADLVHLHWINGGMISIREISKIRKPIVWTIHDMWVFSGTEHYDEIENTHRYKEGYLKGNRPPGHKKVDIDRFIWHLKKKYWRNLNIHFVTPSKWLAKCYNESKLFEGNEAIVIPNALDTTIFKPIEKKIARKILNLPEAKKLVMYGAIGGERNPVKGYKKLEQAKKYLENLNYDISYVIFGNDYKRVEKINGIETHYLGHISDDVTLSLIYSAADVMVVPSIMEAFGQTASEAMACGTPVAAFGATGLLDIVDHKINGYLAEPYDSQDLANGIKWLLFIADNKMLSREARIKVLDCYKSNLVAQKYVDLYKKLTL